MLTKSKLNHKTIRNEMHCFSLTRGIDLVTVDKPVIRKFSEMGLHLQGNARLRLHLLKRRLGITCQHLFPTFYAVRLIC